MNSQLFHSARLKLTFFYLAAILLLSLSMTIGIRGLAEREFERSNIAQRGVYKGIVQQIFDSPLPGQDFEDFQHSQENTVAHQLTNYVIEFNLLAFIIGGLVSYWFAGRTLEPIENAHDAQKQFASDASHELRTPLTTIRTENEVFLRQKEFSTQEAREQIESNLEEVIRLENLSTNLLALTQYENADLELKKTRVQDIVEQAISQVEKTAKEKQITLNNTVANSSINGHEESLTRLVTILLDNAIKYSPPKSTVIIGGAKKDKMYSLSVADEGPGIAESDLDRIFDRLYRGDKARSSKIPGYGLGLSLAKHIARANKASLKAANGKDKGAVFTIKFSN